MKPTKNFASDNNAGIHPEILKAIAEANQGYCLAYGDDPYTERAVAKFREHFGPEVEVFFVFNGTGANVTGLNAITGPFNAVIAPETAHINCDEGGAPEKITGCKLLTVPTKDGKLTVELIEPFLEMLGNQHHNQPKAVSITQSTELGTVYTPAEIRAIADFVHEHNMYLHMDGARLANAAAGLGCQLREITGDAGVDVLSFGGTKNGLLLGEAVVFFRPELARDYKYLRKQDMQLASKMRFISAQFERLLADDLWLKNATNANKMARLLAAELAKVPGITITQKVESNGVFAAFPPQIIPRVQAKYYFYVWDEKASVVRLMTAFDTTEEDIRNFIQAVREEVSGD
jgi:threonine aldolase